MSILRAITGELKYDRIVGTGGIGSGIFFALHDNHTLGREESRLADLLPYKDYCKLHIILHYISILLGAQNGSEFETIPIGSVGNDSTGRQLLDAMQNAGMDTGSVKISPAKPTLFSICYQYPDHSGGNITTAASASSDVSVDDISVFFDNHDKDGTREIVLAAPEVPVETRLKLLEIGRDRGSLNVASLLSGEVQHFITGNVFSYIDLLFINLDEAKKIAGVEEDSEPEVAIFTAIRIISEINVSITVFVTCGAAGVYCYSQKQLQFFPSMSVPVISTAGAGDAFLSATLAGICCGLPLLKNADESDVMSTATELGILVAALSICTGDSINHEITADLLLNFIDANEMKCSDMFNKIFNKS